MGIKDEELTDEDEPEKAMDKVFGIPNFWLTAMKRKDILAELVREFMFKYILQLKRL